MEMKMGCHFAVEIEDDWDLAGYRAARNNTGSR
jgi:hypothetical protein